MHHSSLLISALMLVAITIFFRTSSAAPVTDAELLPPMLKQFMQHNQQKLGMPMPAAMVNRGPLQRFNPWTMLMNKRRDMGMMNDEAFHVQARSLDTMAKNCYFTPLSCFYVEERKR